jgi:2-dehydro-3-deoxyphosphogluconate aldolase / (4S)-4-hydroxy-2-oxoglutarate aldolase
MHNRELALKGLQKQKLLPLYYHESAEVSTAILQALYNGGIRLLEYTNRGVHALENFKVLRKEVAEKMPGLLLGIGTVKNEKQAQDFIEADADFIVCPSTNIGVAKVVADAGLLWVPGCMTPTEIAVAENAAATLVKIFPGNLLGPSYISAVRDIFPGISFMVTGGVESDLKNLEAWFGAGVSAVGMGSKLVTKQLIDRKDYSGIQKAAALALQLVQQAST